MVGVCILFKVSLKNITFIFGSLLGAYGVSAGRDLYCAIPAVKLDFSVSGVVLSID